MHPLEGMQYQDDTAGDDDETDRPVEHIRLQTPDVQRGLLLLQLRNPPSLRPGSLSSYPRADFLQFRNSPSLIPCRIGSCLRARSLQAYQLGHALRITDRLTLELVVGGSGAVLASPGKGQHRVFLHA
ncbi:hypothetical protein HY68_36300 [Streptomyces sp. AcH 505]|nr:hypothetical protein HY68_36300 [Streptomyces sp. AcH 505]